ncbi:MAG: MazG family protein [Clostridia bacterium]|nr:MazG family protein [Oscillospiraceae bacterium]MBQ6702261.1 MazG family protein [Clostridia bacterium]
MDIINEMKKKERFTSEDLRKIMEILRSENGCPWDRVQTHKSIRQDLLEEAYETAEAIDCDDSDMLCEELGDVLLQVMFHSRIAEEEGRFTVDDVYTGVCKKMIERHPHIFGEVTVKSVDDVLTNWDAIKQNSKKRDTLKEQLDGVCKALPALMLASKYAGKCKKSGIDIETKTEISDVSEKTIGKMLFDIAVIAKNNGIDPELALQRECEDFLKKINN